MKCFGSHSLLFKPVKSGSSSAAARKVTVSPRTGKTKKSHVFISVRDPFEAGVTCKSGTPEFKQALKRQRGAGAQRRRKLQVNRQHVWCGEESFSQVPRQTQNQRESTGKAATVRRQRLWSGENIPSAYPVFRSEGQWSLTQDIEKMPHMRRTEGISQLSTIATPYFVHANNYVCAQKQNHTFMDKVMCFSVILIIPLLIKTHYHT